jgi:hypothetical protein
MLGTVLAVATPAFADPLGPYRIHPYANYNKCLDVTDVSYANGAYLQLYDCLSNQQNQQFYLWRVSGTSEVYQIQAIHSWKCLDVKDVSQATGARIQQYDCLGTSQLNQLFQKEYDSGTSYSTFYAMHSGKKLAHYGTTNGSQVVQELTTGTWLWYLELV